MARIRVPVRVLSQVLAPALARPRLQARAPACMSLRYPALALALDLGLDLTLELLLALALVRLPVLPPARVPRLALPLDHLLPAVVEDTIQPLSTTTRMTILKPPP